MRTKKETPKGLFFLVELPGLEGRAGVLRTRANTFENPI